MSACSGRHATPAGLPGATAAEGNEAYAHYSAILGGRYNDAGDGATRTVGQYSTVGGGTTNRASGQEASVSAGASNTASHLSATVSGGQSLSTSADYQHLP